MITIHIIIMDTIDAAIGRGGTGDAIATMVIIDIMIGTTTHTDIGGDLRSVNFG
jgi:hypothetical protein